MVRYASKFPPRLLAAQAALLLAQARADGTAADPQMRLALPDLEEAVADMEAAERDRLRAHAESQRQTALLRGARRDALRWARAFRRRLRIARRFDTVPPMPGRSPITNIRSDRLQDELDACLVRLPSVQRGCGKMLAPDPRFFAQGPLLARRLKEASEACRRLRWVRLPRLTARLREAKGRVYAALSNVSLVGQAVHADDPPRARRFMLTLLHARRRTRIDGRSGA